MPSQLQLDFEATQGGRTQNERLRDIFLAQPGEWLTKPDLGRELGPMAVNSRVADVRIRYGMNIENRQHNDPVTGQRHSYYRYLPS